MGYQVSIMFCDDKQQLERLCKVLNSAMPEFVDDVTVFAIGKLKKREKVDIWYENRYYYIPKGTYFVWWGGERHPFQSGDCIKQHMIDNFGADYTDWYCVFYEYLVNRYEFLEDIDQEKKNQVQENKRVSIIELTHDKPISENVIKKLK